MRTLFLISCLLWGTASVIAQTYSLLFNEGFDLEKVLRTPDGGYLIREGTTKVMKLDGSFNLIWSKGCVLGSDALEDRVRAVRPTMDGGFVGVVSGYTLIPAPGTIVHHLIVFRVNGAGDLMYAKNYEFDFGETIFSYPLDPWSCYDCGDPLMVDGQDAAFLRISMGFGTSSQSWVLKLSSSGDPIWMVNTGPLGRLISGHLVSDLSGGCYILSRLQDASDPITVTHLDGNGLTLWSKSLQHQNNGSYIPDNLLLAPDGKVIVTTMDANNLAKITWSALGDLEELRVVAPVPPISIGIQGAADRAALDDAGNLTVIHRGNDHRITRIASNGTLAGVFNSEITISNGWSTRLLIDFAEPWNNEITLQAKLVRIDQVFGFEHVWPVVYTVPMTVTGSCLFDPAQAVTTTVPLSEVTVTSRPALPVVALPTFENSGITLSDTNGFVADDLCGFLTQVPEASPLVTRIWPNPIARGERLTVDIRSSGSCSLYNASGQAVITVPVARDRSTSIPTTGIVPGIYALVISDANGGVTSARVVVE